MKFYKMIRKNIHKKRINKKVEKKLFSLGRRDQEIRKEKKWDVSVDKKNVEELKKIIREYGWPRISEVGIERSEAAWLIVQHADFAPEFQKEVLKLMKELAKRGEVPLHQIAYLTDRILVNQGKKQVFGTQLLMTKTGKFRLKPTRDLKNVDRERKKFNLPPLKTYKEAIKKWRNKNWPLLQAAIREN